MSRGILYIATGEQFVREAAISATQIREHMPDTPVAIITDVEVPYDHFDRILQISKSDQSFGDQIQYLAKTPFDRTLCIDTDIYMDAPVEDVFDLLDEFDLAAAHNHDGSAYEVFGVPDSFPEYNTGVVAYRVTEQFQRFLDDWQSYYDDLSTPANTQNQPAFRKALYESDLRVATLPSEYNTMVRYPGHALGKVRMFHGRLLDIDSPGAGMYIDVPKAADKINSTTQHRVFTQIGGLKIYTNKEHLPWRKLQFSIQKYGLKECIRRSVRKIRDKIVGM